MDLPTVCRERIAEHRAASRDLQRQEAWARGRKDRDQVTALEMRRLARDHAATVLQEALDEWTRRNVAACRAAVDSAGDAA